MMFGKSYSYLEIMQYLLNLQKKYPDKMKMESIGMTFDKRSIPMLIFGTGKKQIVVSGGVHGRESINPIVLIQMAEDYITRKPSFFEKQGRIYMIPLLNPDGYEIARMDHALWKTNAKGVDINRNFPSHTFKEKWENDIPGSEEETKALMKVLYSVNPDGYLDYHSRGKSIYYYRNQMDKEYNKRQLKIAKALALSTGYSLEKPENEIDSSDSGGNTVHFFSEYFEKPAITIETVADEERFPLDEALQEKTYFEIKDTLRIFLKTI